MRASMVARRVGTCQPNDKVSSEFPAAPLARDEFTWICSNQSLLRTHASRSYQWKHRPRWHFPWYSRCRYTVVNRTGKLGYFFTLRDTHTRARASDSISNACSPLRPNWYRRGLLLICLELTLKLAFGSFGNSTGGKDSRAARFCRATVWILEIKIRRGGKRCLGINDFVSCEVGRVLSAVVRDTTRVHNVSWCVVYFR